MNVIGDDRLCEHVHRVSGRGRRDTVRHSSHVIQPNAPLTSVGVPRDVRVETELSMSRFGHSNTPGRPTPRPCRGVHEHPLFTSQQTDPAGTPRGSPNPIPRRPTPTHTTPLPAPSLGGPSSPGAPETRAVGDAAPAVAARPADGPAWWPRRGPRPGGRSLPLPARGPPRPPRRRAPRPEPAGRPRFGPAPCLASRVARRSPPRSDGRPAGRAPPAAPGRRAPPRADAAS